MPATKSPNCVANWVQLLTRVGVLNGPRSVSPTKAATAVPTPSMGRDPLSTSSTYTPGDRYVGMLSPPHQLVKASVTSRATPPHGRLDAPLGQPSLP